MDALGVDVGGVIIEPADADADTSFFGEHYLRTPPVPGVFEGLAALVAIRFSRAVHLVSKCREQTEAHTREWLAHHDFHGRTGVPVENVHFCRTRADKAPIAEELALTHFVDDKLEVLSYLVTVPHRVLFRPRPAEVAAHAQHLADVRRVETWPELVAVLTPA
jgi:hypothetical protein